MFHQFKQIQKQLLSQISIDTKHILIINCGKGELGFTLRQKFKGAQIDGILFQTKYSESARQHLDKVFKRVEELKGKTYDCVVLIDVHLFLKDPSLLHTLAIQHLAKDGQLFLSFINSQSLDFLQALSSSGNIQATPYPYNLSLLRFHFYKFLLNIEYIYGLVRPETEQLLRDLPLRDFKVDSLSLSLPESGQLFTVFTSYLLIGIKRSQEYKPGSFVHDYEPLTPVQSSYLKDLYASESIEFDSDFSLSFQNHEDKEFLNLMWEQLVSVINNNSYQKILVVGAQEGQLGAYLKQFTEIDYLVGIEEESKLFKSLKQESLFNKLFPSIKELPEEYQGYFDCIICLELQSHGTQPLKQIQVYRELLKPTGSLLISFQNFQNINQLRDLLIYGFSAYFNSQFETPLPVYNLSYIQSCLKQTQFNWTEGLFLVEADFTENISLPLQTFLEQFGHLEVRDLNHLLSFSSPYCLMHAKRSLTQENNPVHLSLVKYTFEHLQSVFYKSNINRFWDQSGKTYFIGEQGDLTPEGNRYREAKFLATRLKSLKPKNVLEIGCGYGRNLKVLKGCIPGVQLTGIDISKGQLKEAKAYLNDESIRLIHYDGVSPLPFDNVSFDLVFSSGVLCILPLEKVKFLCEEMLRVAKFYVVHNEDNMIRDIRFYSHPYPQLYQEEFGYECRNEPNPYQRGYFLRWIDKFKKLELNP